MINFLKYWTASIAVFVLLCIAVFAVGWKQYFQRGSIFSYSVEFTGGVEAIYQVLQPITAEAVEAVLREKGYTGVACRFFEDTKELLIRFPESALSKSGTDLAQTIIPLLSERFADNRFDLQKTDVITASIGNELWTQSLKAVVLGILLILFYIAFRFWSFAYGIASVIALLHDVVVIIAFLIFFDVEISMYVISALLAIIGYSINDTIVIFARIREHAHKGVVASYSAWESLINVSLQETLTRTFLTSFATFITVVPLALFGGPTLRPLSLILLVGFIFGTYSSIFVAPPVMLAIRSRSQRMSS